MFHQARLPAIPVVMTGGAVAGTTNPYTTPDWTNPTKLKRCFYITASKSILDGAVNEVVRRKIINAAQTDMAGDWKIVEREMKSYIKPENPTSRAGGRAAHGQHDDSVSALSLAVLGARFIDQSNPLFCIGRIYHPELMHRHTVPEIAPPPGAWS